MTARAAGTGLEARPFRREVEGVASLLECASAFEPFSTLRLDVAVGIAIEAAARGDCAGVFEGRVLRGAACWDSRKPGEIEMLMVVATAPGAVALLARYLSARYPGHRIAGLGADGRRRRSRLRR